MIFDGLITFASALPESLQIDNFYFPPAVFYHTCVLKGLSSYGYAGTLDAQHFGYKFLGKQQCIAAEEVSGAQKPAAKPRTRRILLKETVRG